ncbi:MAG: hypothetical protein A2X94_12250 [Bdellovibrionales bacterium GWB1_55_8]|nr:MAG: hypothetical protein A2X94_12250 [Bdellovibrionales bacterium GWB1_55_8]
MRSSFERRFLIIFIIGFLGVAAGCARAPVLTEKEGADPRGLLTQVCGASAPGSQINKVKGSAWLKASSKEASGRFPAQVLAEMPDKLVLEVMNLIGGTEALIKVEGRRYKIEIPAQKNRKQQKQEGYHSWGGIPLQFATELFLGRIPCPPVAAFADAQVSTSQADELLVETKPSLEREAEIFRYSFRAWEGRPWVKALHWEKKGTAPSVIDFQFDSPEEGTASPQRWEAKSAVGEVSVRWRERKVTR